MLPFRGRPAAMLGLCLLSLCSTAAAAVAGDGPSILSLADVRAAFPSCALNCLDAAIAKSNCVDNDKACLCNDHLLTDPATLCVRASCTVKETLMTKNTTAHLCGQEVEADESLITVYSVFIAFAIIAVVFRLVARVLTQAYFWWDDLANLLSFFCAAIFTGMNIKAVHVGQGKDIWFVPFDNVTAVVRMFFADMLLYTIGRFFFRASILLFYIRIFPPKSDRKFGRILWGTMIFNLVYNFAFLMAIIFQCQPLPYFWMQWQGLHQGHCGNYNILAWVAAATGIVFDVWLLALPLSQLVGLTLPWKRKIMGGLMFFFGIGVMVVSLIRLKTINEFTQTINPTRDIVQVCLWSGIELDVGVICPCLPSFRLLLRRALGTDGSRSNPSHHLPTTSGGAALAPVPSSGSASARQSLGGMPFAGVGRGPGMGGVGLVDMGNKTTVKYEGSESSDGETVVISMEELVERRRREERRARRKGSR